MIKQSGKLSTKKKRVTTFNLTEENLNKFNEKIGYASRSKVVDNLISDFVNKNGSPTPTRRKTDKPQDRGSIN